MINPATRVREFVLHAACAHDFHQVAIGEIANTETCFKCYTSRFIFHDDEPHHDRHLTAPIKREIKVITDIVIRRPR